jgi:hypothetical protein
MATQENTEIGLRARAIIDEQVRSAFEKAGFTRLKIAQELALIAFSDPARHVEIAEGGELTFIPLDQQGKHRRALKKIREKTVITESKDGEKIYKTSTVEYEMHDKLDAIKQACQALGINAPQKHEVTGAEGGAISLTGLSDEELMKIALSGK